MAPAPEPPKRRVAARKRKLLEPAVQDETPPTLPDGAPPGDAASALGASLVPSLLPALPPKLLPGRPLDADEARALAARLTVLADASRLRLLSRISSEIDGRACVGDLARFLDLRQPTVTHHLQVLHRAGFLERAPDDRRVFYRLDRAALAALVEVLRPDAGAPSDDERAAGTGAEAAADQAAEAVTARADDGPGQGAEAAAPASPPEPIAGHGPGTGAGAGADTPIAPLPRLP